MIAPIENRYREVHVRPERPQSLMHSPDEASDASVIGRTREWIGGHPTPALAIAAVVGLSAAWLIKRKG